MKYKDIRLSSGSMVSLADIYIRRNQLDIAKLYLDSAYQIIQFLKDSNQIRHYYPVLSKWHIRTGNKEEAILYQDSAKMAKDAYNARFNSLKLIRVQQKLASQQMEIQKARMETERYRNHFFIILLIGLIALLAFSLLAYRRRMLFKTMRREAELKDKKNQLEIAKHDLQVAQMNLDHFMASVFEKNELIADLRSQLNANHTLSAIDELQHSIILTQEDWNVFQQLFDKVYPGYRYQLKEKHPSLTTAELRYLLLEKLQLSTNEMATMLGISSNAVQVTRHRLHKKI